MKKVLGGVLIFLAFWSFLLSIYIFSARATILDSKFAKSELQRINAFERVHENIPEIITANIKKDPNAFLDEKNDYDQLAEINADIYRNATTPKDFENLALKFIDSFFPWIVGQGHYPPPIEIGDIRNRIENSAKDQMRKRYESLPICGKKDIELGRVFEYCKIFDLSFDEIMILLGEEGEESLLAEIPDKLSIEDLKNGGAESKKIYENLIFLRGIFSALEWMFIVGALFWVTIIILASRLVAGCLEKTTGVVGAVLFSYSAFGFLISFLLAQKVEEKILGSIATFSDFPILSDVLFRPLALGFKAGIFGYSNKLFLVIFLVGIVMFLGSLIFFHYNEKKSKKSGWSLGCK